MSKILQLNPPIPMITPLGEGVALFVWGDDADTVIYGVFQSTTGENWWWENRFVRLTPTITGERFAISPIFMSKEMKTKLAPHLARHGIKMESASS